MNDINLRKMQEAVANLLQVKDKIAEGLHEMYLAYYDAGFSSEQSFELIKTILTSKTDE